MSADYGYGLWPLVGPKKVIASALVLLARAAKGADQAVFTLLDAHAATGGRDPWKIPIGGMLGSA